MASLVLETATRTALATAIRDLVDAGTAGNIMLRTSGDVDLAEFTLSATSGTLSNGVYTISGTPITSAAAVATGTAAKFVLRDSADTVVLTGDVGLSGSGATAIISNTSIVSGQTVDLTSASFTVPAGT